MNPHHSKDYLFEWHSNCQFKLLIDGPAFYPVMLDAINQAKKYILLEIYLIQSGQVADRFIDALVSAKQRGVALHLLLDDYGARGLGEEDRNRLLKHHIEPVYFNPVSYKRFQHSLLRDHRKILIVDGATAFVGGAGITDDFDPPHRPEQRWHDVMVQIRGPVLEDWTQLFRQTWQNSSGKILDALECCTESYTPGSPGRVSTSTGPQRQEINRSFIKRIRNAERCVWLSTPYFVTTWKIRRTLKRAAKQGIDVRILLPGPISDHPWVSHAARGFYSRLLKNGVRIFELQPRFPHAKVEVCDNWVSIGSSNLDRWNQRWNLDANQEIDDPDFASQVQSMFENNFAQSLEITLPDWLQRSWLQRLREWYNGRIAFYLDRIGQHYKDRHNKNGP